MFCHASDVLFSRFGDGGVRVHNILFEHTLPHEETFLILSKLPESFVSAVNSRKGKILSKEERNSRWDVTSSYCGTSNCLKMGQGEIQSNNHDHS